MCSIYHFSFKFSLRPTLAGWNTIFSILIILYLRINLKNRSMFQVKWNDDGVP
jgi:hypothetical protein